MGFSYNPGISSSASGVLGDWFQGKTAANQWVNWYDAFLPGTTALSNIFDITGSKAASAQAAAQLELQKQAQAYNSAVAIRPAATANLLLAIDAEPALDEAA